MHLFTGLFEAVCEITGTLDSLPGCLGEGLAGGCRRCYEYTHDYWCGQDACEVDFSWVLNEHENRVCSEDKKRRYLLVSKYAHGTDEHRGVHDELFELGEFGCVMIPDELQMY